MCYLVNHATGSAYPAVGWSDFSSAPIAKPTHTVLETFHEVVGDLYEQANSLRPINQNLRQTRDLLLLKLISGELDVDDLDIAVA